MSTNKLGCCIHTTFPLVDVILIALEDSRYFQFHNMMQLDIKYDNVRVTGAFILHLIGIWPCSLPGIYIIHLILMHSYWK